MNDTQIFGGWWQVDRTNELASEVLKRLFDLWRDRHEDGRLPSRQDFDSETLLSFGGRIALIEIESNPRRYRYRLVGPTDYGRCRTRFDRTVFRHAL